MPIFSTKFDLKNHLAHIIFFSLLIIIISGCSTKKNTWFSRDYQAMTTHFNVYYNGDVSYEEGLKNIQKANKEDYSNIIPMYPISHHSNANAATTNMDLTIEKCRKAIKLHSIKIKPDKDYNKANLPEYKLFYNQEEFNPALKEAWLLLGKAEFHKADFIGSVGTFSYIIHHYGTDKNMEAVCQLWIARAYGEMGWIYQAEQVLLNLKQDNLKRANVGFFASVNADLLLKKRQYKAAIPFLEIALANEKDNTLKLRFRYLLAQLYQKTNDNKAAYDTYSKVIKSNPPYEMDFNARISQAQLGQGDISKIRKDLLSMTKNRNNKDYLDQLYFAIGNTYLYHADTLKAIENYKLSAEKSTQNGVAKAISLIKLGDIYYSSKKYVLAQPCYDAAGKIITNENEDYNRVTRLGEMLGQLVTQNDIVVLQDSLQRLSAMPESKRIDVVNGIINKLIADEKAAAAKELKDKQEAVANAEDSFAKLPPIGGKVGVAADWYFYNMDVMQTGEIEFIKKWGKRKLEDNWQRANKSASLFADENSADASVKDNQTDTIAKLNEVSDNKKPEFYLRQIPITPAQLAKSTEEIGDALFSMGEIYKDQIEDFPMSIGTFEEFIRRFNSDKRVPDAYFYIYLMQTKLGNQSEANVYRMKLIKEYPNSKYDRILSQPDYTEKLASMYKVQDSIYSLTYKAFNQSDYRTVYKQVAYIRQNFPLSTLMPKFLFLNALSIGKNETPDLFRTALNDLLAKYPDSDVSAMAKDILALMKQGQEIKTGSSSGSLLTLRDESIKTNVNEIQPRQFSVDKLTKHRILFISTVNQSDMNKLLYNVASFNFSRFMIKDFDLVINKMDSAQSSLSVTNFESYDEAVAYEKSIATDANLTKLMNDYHVQEVIMSEDNYALLKTGFNLKDYLAFQSKQPLLNRHIQLAENKVITKGKNIQEEDKIVTKNTSINTVKVENEKRAEVTEIKVNKESNEKQIQKAVENKKSQTTQATTDDLKKESGDKTKEINQPKQEVVVKQTPPPATVQPKPVEVLLFKGLFGYVENEPHYIAIYIMSGKIDFAKIKTAFDSYNSKNYGTMNLNVTLETTGKVQVIIIGSLIDAHVAKAYLIKMVREKALFEGLKGADYRNLLGSRKNLNTMIQKNALSTYFEFMKEYYLK
ncbi:MAG: hypothetical protein P4L34_10025 [Paludibacter sp.]|nr:hypothetical protein [Paludibacter sp.]